MARTVDVRRGVTKFKGGIVPVSESVPYAKVLIYGRNGKRKTRTAAATGGLNTLVLDVNEEGTQSIKAYPNTEVRALKSWEEFVWGYWYLKHAKHKHKVVVVDNMTQVQKLCMKQVLNEAEDRDPNRAPNLPERRAWGQMTETLRPFIYNYRNLPMHVIFIAQERVDKGSEDEDENAEIRARYVPDLSPGLRGDMMSAVGVMGRMFVRPIRTGKGRREKVVYEPRMLVGDHEDYETKDRTGQLGRIVRKPTAAKIIKAWAMSPPEEDED